MQIYDFKTNTRLMLMLVASITLIFFTDIAQAGFISPIFTPATTDASVTQLLRPLFGGLVDSALGNGGSGGPTALTVIIGFTLQNIIVPVGGLLLFYSAYVGISSAALQAEMFGGKNQSYWVAVRTVVGFGMVMPAPGLAGLALINLFLMTLTLSGVGAASSLWSMVVEQVTKNPVELTTSTPSTDLFDTMLRGFTCAYIYNDVITEHGTTAVPIEQQKNWALLSSDSTLEVYGWTKPGARSDGGCGTIKVKKDGDYGTIANLPGVNNLASVQATATASAQVQSAMLSQSSAVLTTLQNSAAQVAKAEIDSGNVIGADRAPTASYFQTMDAFRVGQQNAAQNIATTAMAGVTSTLKSSSQREGWVTSGFYFVGLGNFQQVVNRAINMSWITSTSISEKDVLDRIADETYHGSVHNQWQLIESYINTGHKQMEAGRILPEATANFGNNPTGWMQMFGKKLNDQVVNSVNNNATPLATAADLGASFIDLGYEILVGGSILKIGSFIPGLGGVIAGSAGSILSSAGWAALGLGVVLTLICLLPALYWGRRVLSWVIRVTVAQIGGPAWMILHVHHAGDGLAGNAGGGYMLALSLVMAPVLDIIGLAVAYLLMVVISPVITSTIMPNITAQGSGTAALLAVFITAIVNGGVIIALLELIGRIEHEVMAFVGGRGSDMNLDGDGDKNRMFALASIASRKIPSPKISNYSGGKKNDDNGASISSAGGKHPLESMPKISTDKLLGKDK